MEKLICHAGLILSRESRSGYAEDYLLEFEVVYTQLTLQING